MPDQVPKAVVQERYERLALVQDRISWNENQKLTGHRVHVMVGAEGKKDAATHRLSGRAEDSRLVHFEVPPHSGVPRPGDIVTVEITDAKPYHLIADNVNGVPLAIRRTRAGDAWDRAEAESCGVPTADAAQPRPPGRVSLGLPAIRVTGRSTAPHGKSAAMHATIMPIYDPSDGIR